MVAILAGNGLGLLHTSAKTLGSEGVLGDASLRQAVNRAAINVANGNLILEARDGQLSGRGSDLLAFRTYNSLGIDPGQTGWRWDYEKTVVFQGAGSPSQPDAGATVIHTSGDGHKTAYAWDGVRGAYVPTEVAGARAELKYDTAVSQWIWTDGSTRATERYSDSTSSGMVGRLIRRTDSTENSIAVSYDEDRLSLIQDVGSRQELRLSYAPFNGILRPRHLEARSLVEDAGGLPTTTLDNPRRWVEYDYDAQGRLATVTRYLMPNDGGPNAEGFTTAYGYDSSTLRVVSLTQSDGTALAFTYDARGRVASVRDVNGNANAQLSFNYSAQSDSTEMTDGMGNVWTIRQDPATQQLTELLTPAVNGTGLSTVFQYDGVGNLVRVTDPENRSVTYGYDPEGNRTLERDALGDTTSRSFSALNQMVTETRYRIADPDGSGPQQPAEPATARFVYDSAARLRFLITPEGRVTENRYGSSPPGSGLLTQTVLYVGQLYDVAQLQPADQLTEADLSAWLSALPDKTQVELTDYTYDLRGNVSQQTRFATVDAAGAGVLDHRAGLEEYVYDAQSQLSRRVAVRGTARDVRTVVTSFTHDGVLRILKTTGPNGLQTTVYDDANRRIVVTGASGLEERRDFDSRGRLSSVTLTGDGTDRRTTYAYDNSDRPRMTEDAQRGRRFRFQDAAGRLEFNVDATGAVTQYAYNGASQVVRQTRYANAVDTSGWYDESSGTVTKSALTVGGSGADVVADGARDRTTVFAYDGAGRLVTSTDAMGVVTTNVYDGLSRVVMTQTGNRASRYLYDKDGRRVGLVDAAGYLTENKYDGGGRLIETVRYSQRSAPAANAAEPQWIGLAQQTLVGGRPFEYRMPAFDADGDPLILSIVAGAPAWLTFDPMTATLRGTPPAAASSEMVMLRADDGRGGTSDVTLALTVIPSDPSPAIAGSGPDWPPLAPLEILAGQPVGYVVPAASGQSLTYSVQAGLPPGLTFDGATRTIGGSSSAIGFYALRLHVSDGSGHVTARTLSMRIRAAAASSLQTPGSSLVADWRPADPEGLHSYFFHDGQGRMVGTVDERQFLTEMVFDEALNRRVTLRYLVPVAVVPGDTLDSVKARAGDFRQTALIEFDGFGRVRQSTALDGSTVTRNEYDDAGHLVRVVMAVGTNEERGRRTFYNAFGETTAVLEGEGDAWLGSNPTPQQIDQAIRDYATRHEYDTLGRVVRSIDANGNRTLFYYDRENRRTHTVNVVGQTADHSLGGEVSETTYNSFGQPTAIHRYGARLDDAAMNDLLAGGGGGMADQPLLAKLTLLADPSRDQLVQYEYDRSGRLVSQIDDEGGLTENAYNDHGELAASARSTRVGESTIAQFDYDLVGRLICRTGDVSGINASTRTDYDAFGRVVRSVDALGQATTTTYRDQGRTIEVTDALQRLTRTEYDALGRVSRLTDGSGQSTTYAYDEAARSTTVTSPAGRAVTTVRTRHGETLSILDAAGNVTRYAYDRDGRPTTVTDPFGRIIADTTYDKSGRRLEVKDARGTATRFAYDQRNRVIEQRTDPGGLNLLTRVEFDALGRKSIQTEGVGSAMPRVTTYTYDRKARPHTIVVDGTAGGLELCTTYGYDGLDNVVSVARGTVSAPAQSVTLYEYDNLARRTKEVAAPAAVFGAGPAEERDLTTTYRYDAGGRLVRRLDANGYSSWNVYDAAGQTVLSISGTGDVAGSRYDASGRAIHSRRYLVRLSPVALAGLGDMATIALPIATPEDPQTRVVYDADGRARFTLKSTGTAGWTISESRYDANGNVVEVRAYDRFLPDARIVALDTPASPGISLTELQQELSSLGYDDQDAASLARVQRSFMAYDAVNRQRFAVDPAGAVTESVHDEAGNVVARTAFARVPSLPDHGTAAIDAAVDRNVPDNRTTRYAYDALNRLRYVVDALGSVSEKVYDARGNVVRTTRWAIRPPLTQYGESAIAAVLATLPPAAHETTRLVFDAGDRLRFTIDPLGAINESVYDALGGAVATIRFAQRPMPGPSSDTEAAVMASLLPLRGEPENQMSRFAYDPARRLRFAVDALGSITENAYDAGGNMVATRSFAVRPSLAQYDEATIAAAVAALQADPRNRCTRFAYDALNRLHFTVDALGSVTEQVYDAGGRLSGSERYSDRPALAQYSEAAIEAAVAPLRDRPGNRVEHILSDAAGKVRFHLLRVSVEAGQAKYRVSALDMNALGQMTGSTVYADAVALTSIDAATITAAVGAGDPQRDRVSRSVYDRAGREIYRLRAIDLDASQLRYRAGVRRFDTFGQLVASTDYAEAVALTTFDEAAIGQALQAVADVSRDRTSAIVYDVAGQTLYSVQTLAAGSHRLVKQDRNALGRLVRTTQYASTASALANFDRAAVETAASGLASADDRKVQYVYDAAGRQRFTLEAAGSDGWTAAESRFDATGNLIEARRYDLFLTEAWIDGFGVDGPGEQQVMAELAALGYSDTAPATLARIERSRYAYDTQNRRRFSVDARGSVVETIYDVLGDPATVVSFAGRPSPASSSERGIDQAVDRSDVLNRIQHSAYDAAGQLRFSVQVIEPNTATGGRHSVSERRYDALGQLAETRAYAATLGHLNGYDEATLAAAVLSDPVNDRRSAVAYDAGGRQSFAARELRVGTENRFIVTEQAYDALGQLLQRIEFANPVSPAQLDEAGVRSALLPDFRDRITQYVRDAVGRPRFEVRPDLSFRESRYDALDQAIETCLFDLRAPDHTLRTVADMVALRDGRSVGDGLTRGQRNTFDAAGRLVGTVDAVGNTQAYEYDALDGRVAWVDKAGNRWTCRYDRKGRKISETTPPVKFKLRGEPLATPAPDRALETRFAYDAFGNLTYKVEAANFAADALATDFQFDTVGQPTGTLYGGYYDTVSHTVERQPAANRFRLEAVITYDAMGNTVRIGNRTGVNSLQYSYQTYDSQGRVVHEINALNHVTRYTYNAFGERAIVTRYSVTISGTPQNGVYWTPAEIDPKLNWGRDENGNLLPDPYARTITLTYDKLARKSSVTQPTATYYSTSTPGDASQANAFRLSPQSVTGTQDAAATRYEYDAFGQLTLQRVRANIGVEWQDTSFVYDAMGRRAQTVDAAGFTTYSYYDAAGNLVQQEEPSGQPDGTDRVTGFAYNVLDQQIRVDRYGLRYTDANGVEHGVAVWHWENGGYWDDPDAQTGTTVRTTSYDVNGRPVAVTDAAGNVTSMRYNALGQLVEVIAPARPIAPLGANGEEAVDPFRNQLSENLVASLTLDAFGRTVRVARATSQGGDARVTQQAFDPVGNLVSTTDAEGNVKRRYCDPSGRVIRETQAIHAVLGPLGTNDQGLERRYRYDALGQLTDTLDIYVDGTDLVQSGKCVAYNAFGEVAEERRKWGPASQDIATLNTALVSWHHYDNAGHVFEKLSADRLTLYFYNLLGQVTREEKRGNSGDSDGTGRRITEIQYDILGRPTFVRRPVFDADVTPETGTSIRQMTPYSLRMLDRWGNVRATEEGGYDVQNGQPWFAPFRMFRSYIFDDNSRVVYEGRGTHEYVTASGGTDRAVIATRTYRDLLGNAVKEVDEASDLQTDVVVNSRTRIKQYDPVGRVLADIDATGKRVEYAYNIHGDRLGQRNARGTVMFDRFDRNGNVRFRGILRTTSSTGPGEYDSRTGVGTIARTYLNAYLYDQAKRRFASKTFTEGANAPWSYTWFDGRNLGVRQSDPMGLVTQSRFDQFGNKSVEIDSAGRRSEWYASTADYAAGRIESYRLPSNIGTTFGQYTFNDYSEVRTHTFGNTMTEYARHKNGLVLRVTTMPDTTHSNVLEITTYQYDVRGQATSEARIDSQSLQTRLVSYDNQGRLWRVEDQNKFPWSPICDVHFAYDEWSNVRRIRATYTPTAADPQLTTESWYDYDAAGRLTVSNGALSGGTIKPKMRISGSVRISYDAVGRRSGTTEYVRSNTTGTPVLRTWDTMRDERYDYDDLGHLRRIDQRVRQVNIINSGHLGPGTGHGGHGGSNGGGGHGGTGDPTHEADKIGAWQPLSERSANLRGDVTRSQQWTRISGLPNSLAVNQVPAHLNATTTSYRADGQVTYTRTDADDPKKSTQTTNFYDAQTGQLDHYVFSAFRSDGAPFSTTFQYSHTFQNGQRLVSSIHDIANGMYTRKNYDLLGRLASERVDLQKPNGPGTDRYETRTYSYAADGRAILKKADLLLSSSGPGTVPLTPPTTGQQTYVYGGQRMVATVGAQRLAGNTKFDFAYTPMSEATDSGSSRYIVQNGDSLYDIAQANYGDSALWYLIADANGIIGDPGEALASTEVGKAYEIPGTLRSSQTANTFTPFGMADIVGDDRPIAIPPPPPPKQSDLELIAVAAISITVQAGVTVGLSALGVPVPISAAIGSGLSSLAGQATSWELGMQKEGIDWGNVGISAAEGYLFSVAGPVAGLTREVWQQSKTGFSGWSTGGSPNWSGIGGSLFNVGFDALGQVVAGGEEGVVGGVHSTMNSAVMGFVNSAYNPRSGWAMPGSGRSPTVGAFEYTYGVAANAMANAAFTWLSERLSQPSAPVAPKPRSVDEARGPISPDIIDMWDDIDREYVRELDEAALAARNDQIRAESDERLRWQLQFAQMQDRIDHLGENIDDHALISAALRERNNERVRQEQQAALARARAAASAARLRANSARFEAMMARGPDPKLVEYVREMDELNNRIMMDMYADGFYVHVSHSLEVDGLILNRGSEVRETMGLYSMPNTLADPEMRQVFALQKQALANEPYVAMPEIIVMESAITPAEQSRRLGLADVKTFNEFSRNYVKQHGTSDGVEQAFLEYHTKRSEEITANWKRIDNAAGAVNLIAKGTLYGVQFVFDPVGTVASIAVGYGTEKALVLAGVPEDAASLIGDLAGSVTGLGVNYAQIAKAGPSVQSLLAAERAARAEFDTARLALQAAEWEASRGVRIAEDVTLFKGVPPQARIARPGFIPDVAEASAAAAVVDAAPALEKQATQLLLEAPASPSIRGVAGELTGGGLPARPGVDYHPPASVPSVAPFEATPTRGPWDVLDRGFEPRSGSIASITNDTVPGFPGTALGRPTRGLPAIWYDRRLVTVYNGKAYYRSLGESASHLEGAAEPFFKEPGTFYEMLGVQERKWVFNPAEKPISRGWVIKGYNETTGEFLGKNIPFEPELKQTAFDIQGFFKRPEQVNQWLAANGFTPWVDLRHFFPDTVGSLLK